MANLRIKKKHIDENAIDGTKIKLLQDEAIKAVDAAGSVVNLVKLDSNGYVEGNGQRLATKSELLSAESSLGSRLNVLEGDENTVGSVNKALKDANHYTTTELSIEKAARISADDELQENIDAERNARVSADTAEQSSRMSADTAEQSSRISADESLYSRTSTMISTEASSRVSGDESLSSRIDVLTGGEDIAGSLSSIYRNAKIYTDAKVSVEESKRISADESIHGYFSAETSLLSVWIDDEEFSRRQADQEINTTIINKETSILGKLNLEENSRKAADSSLESRLNTADSSLESRLNTVQGDENTAGSINKALKDANIYTDNKAITVTGSVVDLINLEVTSRQVAVSAEASLRVVGDESLTNRLNTVQGDENTAGSINKALKDAKDYTNTKFDQEKAWRESADLHLHSRIDSILSNTDPAALDSLAEIVQSFQSVDGTLSGAISNISFNIKADLSVEVTSRMAAVYSIDDRLGVIQGDEHTAGSINKALKDAKDYTNTKFDQEKAWREANVLSIDSRISSETSSRVLGDESLTNRLNVVQGDENTEGSIKKAKKEAIDYADQRAINVSQSIVDLLALEITSRQVAVSAEASLRVVGDDSLSSRLNTVQGDEHTAGSINKALKDAKDYTNTKFDQEKAWRESADHSLSNRIDYIVSNTDPAALDSLTEIVNAFQSVDGTLSGAISNISFNIKADLSVEVTSRMAAVYSIDNRIHSAEDRLDIIQGTGEGSIYQARQNAYFYTDQEVGAEKTLRAAADESLDSKISSETSSRISADSDLNDRLLLLEGDYLTTGSIANMLSSAKQYTDDQIDAEESARQTQIEQEIAARISADNVEADLRIGADNSLSTRIGNEVNDRVDAVNTEQSSRISVDAALSSQISTESSTRAVIVAGLNDALGDEASYRIAGDLSLEMLLGDSEFSIEQLISSEKDYVLQQVAAETTSRQQAIADLVGSAPVVLDTLKELADALGGDENFATTIAGRLGEIENSVTAATSLAEAYTDTKNQGILDLISATLIQQETLTISAQNVQDGFVPLSGTDIVPRSMTVFVDRLCMFEGVDYSLTTVSGTTRLTFLNSFATGGTEEIEENTVLRLTYWSVPS